MSFYIDTHIHTREVSNCSRVFGRDMVHIYKQMGYGGVVVSDHYHDEFFDGIFPCSMSWEEKAEAFIRGYREARDEGEKINFTVLLGMEINFAPYNIDFLVFGIDEAFLINNPRLWSLSLKWFKKLAEANNLLVYQAHPCRPGTTPANPDYIDGVEVYNGINKYYYEQKYNDEAMEYAINNNKKMSAGSDFHFSNCGGLGGLVLPERPKNSAELAQMMREDSVDLYRAGMDGTEEPDITISDEEQFNLSRLCAKENMLLRKNGVEVFKYRINNDETAITVRNPEEDDRIVYLDFDVIGLRSARQVFNHTTGKYCGYTDRELWGLVKGGGETVFIVKP